MWFGLQVLLMTFLIIEIIIEGIALATETAYTL